MRHLKRKLRLTKSQGHRKAILKNIAKSLFIHKRISTTLGKAKAAQAFIEKTISHARKGGLQAYRLVEYRINDKVLTKRVVEEIAPQYKERNGGYTRIIKDEPRIGDCAPMAILELVGDYTLTPYPPKKEKPEAAAKKDESETKEKKVVKKVVVEDKKKETEKE